MWVALDTATDRASVALGTPGTVALLSQITASKEGQCIGAVPDGNYLFDNGFEWGMIPPWH